MNLKRCVFLDGIWRAAQIEASCPEGVEPGLKNLDFFEAQVPGELHKDLIRNGRIENLFAGTKACASNEWVSEADWVYEKTFAMPDGVEQTDKIFLNLDSVDTFSDVFINGQLIGSTANAFIRQCFEVPFQLLSPNENRLVVRLKGHRRMVADKAPEAEKRCALDGEMGREFARSRSLTRRSQRTYSSELTGCGRYITGIGLPKSVAINIYPEHYLTERIFRVLRADEKRALIHIQAQANHPCGGILLNYELTAPDGSLAAEGTQALDNDKAVALVSLDNPMLWWPNGFGPQNLYQLKLKLIDGQTSIYEEALQVGIRQVELIRRLPNDKPTFQFRINGKPVYIFGGNIMPIDYLMATGSPEQSKTLLDLAVHTNINMIRLWGGGNNESEWFYQMCDQKGLMIFKDMHLHSHTYPDYDPDFVKEVAHECAETIRYLRNHPCLALICGGNEQQEGWDAWHWRAQIDQFYGAKLIYDVFPAIAQRECPEIAYIPNSPHGERLSQSPVDGETHTWGNFYNATKDPQFVTETCWFYGSFPHRKTMEKYMGIRMEDFEGFGWAQKWKELTGQELIGNHQYGEYHLLGSLQEYMYSMEIEQLLADTHALFYLRCRSASCNGIIYWPFNKGGMFILFGCVDYDQRPLMSYYLLRRVFAPVACHLYRDISDVRLVVSNACWDNISGECVIRHMHTDGRELNVWRRCVTIGCGNAQRLVDLPNIYETVNDRRNEMFRAEIYVQGSMIAYDDLYLCAWSEFENRSGALTIETDKRDGEAGLNISSDVLAKMIYLDSDEKLLFEDNCFSLMPGQKRRIWVRPLTSISRAVVTITSLDGQNTGVELTFH